MATTVDFIEYVYDQIQVTGQVRYRKMFGEYMVYVNEKPLLLVCDNTVYIKQVPCVQGLLESAEKGFPYRGAKEHYILDIEDAELAAKVVEVLERHTSVPVKRKKRSTTSEH